ncbi:S-adenosyl-L-methionine-dependent methyltransferase [Annulohypoxylon maeteangense]|uniref:S-adenosyl-L-methionine-dependent methyltransferase n=1 Tax=Annulohypoxylon maeteangense TaxID=1927788 RepID=UPI002007F138|nr:S-adenosyl-L-methionine-dependent methyltransferase [Annulohypoxylon maeteangense]KAI0885066.1 S-adenosyl-L-methionine-dependent methyltransferase [Annulohypoxylon maeteangense]
MKSIKHKPEHKKPSSQNPIEIGIRTWFNSVSPKPQSQPQLDELIARAPKRWTTYEPMVLLPSGSFTTAPWKALLSNLSAERTSALWTQILSSISKKSSGDLTHLAINEGIPAALHPTNTEQAGAPENILRSPTGLRTLHGDFGPASACGTAADFTNAFWVSTRQNGVFQTWAPRWTMFSRGNIKEKARLLEFHKARSLSLNTGTTVLSDDVLAVDLYAGIGYFTFSYAKLGMRVLCWELNPWSVEGLRRGAEGNGWSVRVVRDEAELALPMGELVRGGERIVVFLEDNRHAARRIRELGELNILHVNCGLLPSSEASWKDSWDIAARSQGEDVWFHLHENVGVADIEKRREEIEQYFLDLGRKDGSDRTARVKHTELVKTFAPGVWHCVFDLHITRSSSII